MPKTRQRDRVYWRERGGERRAYGDFRDYRDVGGGREALIPPGRTQATTDPEEADIILAERLKELDAKRRGLVFHGAAVHQVALGAYASEHLVKKAKAGRFNPAGWGCASST